MGYNTRLLDIYTRPLHASPQFDYYLSDMLLALEVRIGINSLLEGKDFVYHWMDLTRCKESVHVLKLFDRANQNSAEDDRF